MNILNYAVLSLLRSWQKQVALIVIYALVVGFYASVVFFTSSLKTETSQTLQDLPPLWVQQLQGKACADVCFFARFDFKN